MYLVLIKDKYGNQWDVHEVETTDDVLEKVGDAKIGGNTVRVAVEMAYSVKVELHEPVPEKPESKSLMTEYIESKEQTGGEIETPESTAEPDSSTRGKSHRKV